MNDRNVSPRKVRVLYSFFAVLATVAATKAMVWPTRPVAQPLDQVAITKALTNGGFKTSLLKPLAAKNDSELATSDVIGYSVGNGLELRLMRGVARKRFNLQAAFFAKSHPELRLIKRELSNGKPSYAIGLIQSRPTNQTCLVEGGRSKDAFAVTRNDLSLLIDQASRTKWSTLKSIIGLQPNRDYQCILIQVQSTDKTATAIDQPTWLRMLSIIQAALQSKSSHTSIYAQT
jgi:hypothetical protein